MALERGASLPLIERTQAAAYFKQRVAQNPGNSTNHHVLAPLLQANGDSDGCYQHLLETLRLNPSNPDARNDLGMHFFRQGDYKSAITELKRALMLDSDHQLATRNLGAVYAKKGRVREALKHTKRACELNPQDPVALRNYARLMEASGSSRDALKYYKRAIDHGPGQRGGAYDKMDADAYKAAATLTITQQRSHTGEHMQFINRYRQLSGKRFVVPDADKTRELLRLAGK